MAEKTTSGGRFVPAGISVVIPVYNEAGIINDTIRHLRDAAGDEPVEVVVCDGGPGRATLRALAGPDVTRVESAPGRGRQMNAGAAQASGDILLFLHADTRLPRGWPEAVRRGLARRSAGREVVAGAFRLVIDSPRPALRLVAWFANLRTRLERLPYGDQAQFIRAETFRALGGYPEIPVMEDVELFMTLRQRSLPVVILDEAAITSPRRWERDGVARRTLCNWWLRLRHLCGASPQALARHYEPYEPGDRP
jgi:rSAM/selenodomain-associated transferase 2